MADLNTPGDMNIEVKNTSELKYYPGNPRKASKELSERIKNSIAKFGFVEPLVINPKNEVIGGNQRLRALHELKVEKVVCIIADLDPENEKALNLALNKISGDWDMELLRELIVGMADESLMLAGFEEEEIKNLKNLNETIEGEEDDFDPNTEVDILCKTGDIWQLGKHRLLCGDSTVLANIEKLMDGREADVIFTDPPYNVDYTGKTKDALKIQNDKKGTNEFYDFLRICFENMCLVSKLGAPIYVCHADSEGLTFRKAFIDAGWDLKQCLIWNKNCMVMGRQDYHWKHEPILYGWKPGGAHKWYGGRNKVTVWDIERPSRSTEHPTMKPVMLISTALHNSSYEGDLILDVFGGSGTTLIAAERMNRICYMMELDPKYAGVIIARWEELTGQKAERLVEGQNETEMKYHAEIKK